MAELGERTVSDTPAHLGAVLARDLEALRKEIDAFPDDPSVWLTLPGVTNAAGTLALHVCGNLKHFVGAVLGHTGFVRDRDGEFNQRGLSRAQLGRDIAETVEVVRATLGRLPADALAAPYPATPNNLTLPTGLFLLHLAAHLAFHLGQAGYLRRIATGDARPTGAMSLAALGAPPAPPPR